MLDVDSFDNLLSIVRTCIAANRVDLIEPSLIDRQHLSAVMARIETERASRPAGTTAAVSYFGGPTPAERDGLQAAVGKRLESQYGIKPAG